MSANNNIKAYKFAIDLQYRDTKDSQPIKINPDFIRYMIIERKFSANMMPVIYVSMVVNFDLYYKIYQSQTKKLNNQKTESVFILEIKKYNKLAQSNILERTIKDEFDFVMSKESKVTERTDGDTKAVTVALLSNSLLNASRAERDTNNSVIVSGVFNKIDMATLIAKVFEGIDTYGLKSVIKSPVHNTEFKKQSLVIPPMNSRKDIIDYLFDKAPFYDTNPMFFLDFNTAYLIDRTKNGLKVNDNTPHDVIFNIYGELSDFSYVEGMVVKKDYYQVYESIDKCILNPNQSQDKLANTIITVNDNGDLDYSTVNNNSSIYSDPKYVFKRGANSKLYKNNMNSRSITVTLVKENMDGSMFTPNKRYRIKDNYYEGKYSGYYYLDSRKEVLVNNAGDFSSSVEFTLQKIGKIEDIGDTDGDTGSVSYNNGYTEDEISVTKSSKKSKSSRHSQTTNSNDTSIEKSVSNMVSVKNTKSKSSSGSSVGSDTIAEYQKGNLEGKPLKNAAVTLGSPARMSVEEEVRLAEERRTPRIHGDEVDYSSSGPVKTLIYNPNISTSKYIEIE